MDNYKKICRNKNIKNRKELPINEVKAKSKIITSKLISIIEDMNVSNICSYMPIKNEVDTTIFNQYIIEYGYKLYLPKIVCGKMRFFAVDTLNSLKKGSFDVLEPIEKDELNIEDKKIVIVPLVGYDPNRRRLGYGKGYYDRFFSNDKNSYFIGLAYKFQKCEKFFDDYDLQCHQIITEDII